MLKDAGEDDDAFIQPILEPRLLGYDVGQHFAGGGMERGVFDRIQRAKYSVNPGRQGRLSR